ncbi:MAG: LDCC motif putative metal-binding protein [Bacteroidota bacterium]
MLGWWKNFLKRLAEANTKEFGNQRPNCCDFKRTMNQSDNGSHRK